ncbi:hypothetical protein BC628DRAFT_5247 [Trametes gibbosa]|nr:hypothetical protein BC628DRAFT_5247 [Trametes gibbosa]
MTMGSSIRKLSVVCTHSILHSLSLCLSVWSLHNGLSSWNLSGVKLTYTISVPCACDIGIYLQCGRDRPAVKDERVHLPARVSPAHRSVCSPFIRLPFHPSPVVNGFATSDPHAHPDEYRGLPQSFPPWSILESWATLGTSKSRSSRGKHMWILVDLPYPRTYILQAISWRFWICQVESDTEFRWSVAVQSACCVDA